MGIFFHLMIAEFSYYLDNDYSLKAIFILIFVFLSILFYLLVSFLIKAFKLSDIRAKY
jgi:putative peptidoglycan lipid II flippase